VTLRRTLTSAPYLLIVLATVAVAFALVVHTDRVATAVVDGFLRNRTGGAYSARFEDLSFTAPGTVAVRTVTVVATDRSRRVSTVSLSDVEITYDLTAPFRGETRDTILDLAIAGTAVYLRLAGTSVPEPGSGNNGATTGEPTGPSESSAVQAAPETSSNLSGFIERTARREEVVFRIIEEFFLPRPLVTTVDLFGVTADSTPGDTGTPGFLGSGTLEIGSRAAFAGISIGRYRGEVMIVADPAGDAPLRTDRRGTLTVDGPGITLAADIDGGGIAFSGRYRSGDFAPPELPPRGTTGGAAADPDTDRSFRFLEAFESVTLHGNLTIAGPLQDRNRPDDGADLRPRSSLPLTRGLRYLFDTAHRIAPALAGDGGAPQPREPADPGNFAALLPEFSLSVETVGISPAFLNLSVPPEWYLPLATLTAVADEERIGISATVDGGELGILSLEELIIPRAVPGDFTVSHADLAVPGGVDLPARLVPPSLKPILRTVGDAASDGSTLPLPEMSVHATMTNPGSVEIEGTAIAASRYRLAVDATIDTTTRRISAAVATLQFRDDRGEGGVEVSLSAPWDALKHATFGTIPGELRGTLEGEIHLAGDDTPRYGSIQGSLSDGVFRIENASGRYGPYDFWTVPPGGGADQSITGDGTAYRLEELALAVVSADPNGAPPSETEVAGSPGVPGHPRTEPALLTLDGAVYRDGVVADASLTGFRLEGLVAPRISGDADVEEPPSDRPGSPTLTGAIDTELALDTRNDRPTFSLAVVGDEIDLFGQRGTLSVTVLQDGESVLIPSGSVQFGPLVTASVSGRLPVAIGRDGIDLLNLAESTLEIDIESPRFARFFRREEGEQIPDGALSASITLAEQTGDLSGTIRFRGRTVTGVTRAGSGGFGFDELVGRIRITEERYDRMVGELSLTADDREVVTVSADAHIPGLSEANPTTRPDEITWRLKGRSQLPIEYIAPFLPGVIALTGSVDGEIAGSGSIASPRLGGRIALRDGEVRLSGALPAISAINGAVRFDDRRFFSEQLRGEAGLAPFEAVLEGSLPTPDHSGEYTLRLSGENLLVTSSPSLRVRADIDATLRRDAAGETVLGGNVAVRDAVYSRQIPLIDFDAIPQVDPEVLQLFSVPGRFGETTRLDVTIIADETLRVENNLYTGSFSADLSLAGTLGIPRPAGRIFADSGTLTLPLTSVSLRQGVLRFPVDRPFSPELQARGTTRMRDYQLTATVQGTLPEVEVDVTTVPALPQGDALVLLLTGFTPAELGRSGNRTALALGSRLGTQVVRSLLGSSGEAGAELADRVNVILGEGVSDGGTETIEIEFRLSDEDSWFLVFRRDRFERYNMDLAWRFWLD